MTKNFYPQLFISIGATGAYYTLRETYLHTSQWGNEVRSMHLQNLSQDFDEAFAKALYISLEAGIPMLSQERAKLETEMRDIHRATAAEMERRAEAQRLREEMWAVEREARRAEVLDGIKNGMVLFGHYNDTKIIDLPLGYINWLMNTNASFEEGSYIRALSDEVLANYQHLRLPTANGSFFGSEKQKFTANVTVTRVGFYTRPCYDRPWLSEEICVVTMISDDGFCFVSKNNKFRAKVGEKMTISAKVKSHDFYNGQTQTVVNYIKVLDEVKVAA